MSSYRIYTNPNEQRTYRVHVPYMPSTVTDIGKLVVISTRRPVTTAAAGGRALRDETNYISSRHRTQQSVVRRQIQQQS